MKKLFKRKSGEMAEIYLVCWTGGYEAPSYWATDSLSLAFDKATEWAKDAREGEDEIDLLRLTPNFFGGGIKVQRCNTLDGPVHEWID